MFDWQDFETVFRSKLDYTPDQKQIETTLRHRKEFQGSLFFDRIWNNIGLKQPAKSYPPKSNQDLRNLWSKIVNCSSSDEHKIALLYYILKDCKQLGNTDIVFARRAPLSPKYQLLVTGLWELDHGQFSRALEHLTDPSLPPTFADEILLVLLTHPKCDDSLAMAYHISVSPPLQDQATLETYFALLIRTNVVEAYHFAKRQSQSKHKKLLEDLIVSIHEEEAGNSRAERALLLVGLPLSPEEETWFEDCLLNGAASNCKDAKDSVMMRRIVKGNVNQPDPAGLNRLRGQKIEGINWENIRGVFDHVASS